MIKRKYSEQHHITDYRQEHKRFLTGFLGEAALEVLLRIKIIDWNIGNSSKFHHPDIQGYSVGVKTVERGKFPIIFKKNDYPQIICVRNHINSRLIFVCGLATTDVLNKFQDDNLILGPCLRARGTKTGFYGFQFLKRIGKIEDIRKHKK